MVKTKLKLGNRVGRHVNGNSLVASTVKVACLAILYGWSAVALAGPESMITGIHQPRGSKLTVSIEGNGHPGYSVDRLDGGYRDKVIFKNSHFTGNALLFSGTGKGRRVSNVLAVNKGNTAELDVLLSSPQKISVEPSVTGYAISFANITKTPDSQVGKKDGAGKNPGNTAAVVSAKVSPHTGLHAASFEVTSISGLHFHREKNGAGMLSLSVTGQQPELSAQKRMNRLILTLNNTRVAESFVHRFGTGQFGTVVNSVDIYPIGKKAQVVFHINGDYSYATYQIGHRIMVSVRHMNSSAKNGNALGDKRLSINFQNIDVRDAIDVIAKFTHQNIVVSNSVNGSMSLQLKDEPWREAFRVILESQGLAVKHFGNILWVAPAGQISSQEEAELKAEAAKRKLEPLVTDLIQLKYARANQVATLLQGFSHDERTQGHSSALRGKLLASALGIHSGTMVGNSLLGARGTVSVVRRTNSLLVRDTPQDIINIKHLIAKIDKPVPQVLIEARIVQVTTNAAQSLGIQWGGSYTSNGGGGIINLSGTGASGTTSTQGGDYPVGSNSNSNSGTTSSTSGGVPALVNLPAAAPAGSPLTGLNPASLGFALGNASGSRILDLQLQALQAENKAKIISSPKVLTEDNESAVIAQGTEIPYQQASSSGATAVTFKKAELSLKVTPHIAPNGKVTMNVEATNNQPNYSEAEPGGIPINTQEIKTKLLVNNGQTVVIGGIYTATTTTDDSGVPVLQNIPLLGWLFKAKEYNDSQTELLVFITPKVIGENK